MLTGARGRAVDELRRARVRVRRAVSLLRLEDLEITADLSGKKVVDLPVAWNRRGAVRSAIHINGVCLSPSQPSIARALLMAG